MSATQIEPGSPEARRNALVVIALGLAFAVVLVRTAWISDDALITLRTVRNLLEGDGLRWNIAERVQTFSHPLWMGLLAVASFVTREFYLTTLLLGGSTTLVALWVMFRSAASSVAAALALCACIASSAFVDYATSGLENPLTHVAVAALVWLHTPHGRQRDPAVWHRLLGLAAGLAALNRLDGLLLFVPALGLALWRARGAQALRDLAIGFVPLALWESFALIYYGFPFPNTAYAKLGAGIPRLELLTQGLLYLRESLVHDPITLSSVVVAAFALGVRSTRGLLVPAAGGALLYLVYVAWIGGDFMSGRFLTAPFFLCVCALAACSRETARWRDPRALAALGCIHVLGTSARAPRLLSGSDFSRQPRLDRISDERSVYFERFGWWSAKRAGNLDLCAGMEPFRGPVSVRGSVGHRGFCEPREHFILDRNALGDALLSRLPARPRSPLGWQPGHFTRGLPAGYRESIESGENRLEDEELRSFYEELLEATRGEPLLAPKRLAAIWALNSGRYHELLSHERFALRPARSHRELDALSSETGQWRWQAPRIGGFEIPRDGIDLKVPGSERIHAASITLQRRAGSVRGIDFLSAGELVGRLLPESANAPGKRSIPSEATRAGFDTVRIHPGPVKLSNMHHLRLRPDRGGPGGLLFIESVQLGSTP